MQAQAIAWRRGLAGADCDRGQGGCSRCRLLFQSSSFKGSSFKGSSFKAPLSKAPLSKVPLSKAPLSEVPLSKAPLSKAPLSEAPLSKTAWSGRLLAEQTAARLESAWRRGLSGAGPSCPDRRGLSRQR